MVNLKHIPCIAGSTGLVGSHLLENLSNIYPRVISLTRKKVNSTKPNIQNIIVDFDDLKIESIFKDVDHLYIALGTTRKKAGSAYNFKKVDYHYCINLARIANDCGVKSISIISSVGSDPNSSFLYPMTKGLIEKDISKISLQHLSIVRPGIILGKRNESRIGEKIGKVIFSLIDKLLFGKLSKYKSISADNISKAMIYQVINSSPGVNILEYKELINSSNSFDDLIKLD
ncbi:NAD-dependent epimerase/dehydratase family protein [Flavobacteriaceae bacterium]|nr:NAD-dependent epimerase/dehydratase family protein [Flavobacteriaceae bacterium]MDB4144530.1 NAD-dependent epimerase/dehydratase family protein [Flavobacteriaceae bacterium]